MPNGGQQTGLLKIRAQAWRPGRRQASPTRDDGNDDLSAASGDESASR